MPPRSKPLATSSLIFTTSKLPFAIPVALSNILASSTLTSCIEAQEGRAVTNKQHISEVSTRRNRPSHRYRAGEDEYLFTKAVAMVREWLGDSEEKYSLSKVLKEILAEAGPPAGNRPLD